nr:hypothetical protein [Tanacetum cinerariifolium]
MLEQSLWWRGCWCVASVGEGGGDDAAGLRLWWWGCEGDGGGGLDCVRVTGGDKGGMVCGGDEDGDVGDEGVVGASG